MQGPQDQKQEMISHGTSILPCVSLEIYRTGDKLWSYPAKCSGFLQQQQETNSSPCGVLAQASRWQAHRDCSGVCPCTEQGGPERTQGSWALLQWTPGLLGSLRRTLEECRGQCGLHSGSGHSGSGLSCCLCPNSPGSPLTPFGTPHWRPSFPSSSSSNSRPA